jgi:hypothetical protein
MWRRQSLRIIRPETPVAACRPWWRARGLMVTGAVLWWLLTFAWGLAKALVVVALAIIGAVLMVVGILTHFVGGSR